MGDCGGLPRRHRHSPGISGASLHWRGHCRHSLLWRPVHAYALSVAVAAVLAQLAPTASGSILGKLLLFLPKAGSLTFGSGLAIVPLLEQGLIQQFSWLDQRHSGAPSSLRRHLPPVVSTCSSPLHFLRHRGNAKFKDSSEGLRRRHRHDSGRVHIVGAHHHR